jgi:hypothetical protein
VRISPKAHRRTTAGRRPTPGATYDDRDEATAYYQAKYGQAPNLVYANPSNIVGSAIAIPGVEIRQAQNVLPNHIWVGVDARLTIKMSA